MSPREQATDTGSTGAGSTDSGSICIGCGLCCDGTVVTHLAVQDESDLGAPLRARGVELLYAAEPPVFELPCPALVDRRCAVHDLHRPRACAQFECRLSMAVLEGSTTPAEARAVIAEALRRRTAGRLDPDQRAMFDALIDERFRPS